MKTEQVLSKNAIIDTINTKNRKTLDAVMAEPTLASIKFSHIENLLMALGAELTEGNGSRVKLSLNGQEWHAHRPHPGKEAKRYQVEAVREFLKRTGMI
jgi:hypothetical protein